jgi:hypothetical protein
MPTEWNKGGKTIVYEGHDTPRSKGGPDPKSVDQSKERFYVVKTNMGGCGAKAPHFVALSKQNR